MSNPLNPSGNGILKLSDGNIMLYPYGEDQIVTVDNGGDKLKINAFDISSKDNPKLLYSQELGGSNISSSVFEIHRHLCLIQKEYICIASYY